MEFKLKNNLPAVLCFTVLVLCPFVRAGCQNQLMQDAGFLECVTGFSSFFTNLGSGGTDMSDSDAIFKTICSPQGKSAFGCMLKYMGECPELMSGGSTEGNPMASLGSIPGFDMQMFLQEGGMKGVCAMMTGPCSKVKDCYSMPQGGPGNQMRKRQVQSSVNYYMMFHQHTNMMCGPMKEQMTCMLNALEHCPSSVVNQVEVEFEKAMNMSMTNTYGVISFKDTKSFVQNTCSKLPQGFAGDTCTMGVYVSQNFTMCNENVTMKYSEKKSCDVHELSKQCIADSVQPKCGNDVAVFLTHNTHMIFPGIPDNCEDRDVSGSDMMQTSFSLLMISTFLTMLYTL